MSFQRFHDAPKVDMPLATRESGHVSLKASNAATTLVLTLAAFALHVWLAPPSIVEVPRVIGTVPPPSMVEDCRAQNFAAGGRLLAQCEDLEPAPEELAGRW